ncbi:MAG: class I SAM-dependent methyltransferase [Methanomicrobiaceae archaeon]|nr:class I SAM-dependent methyltransferase [Methanomicrobiaceae archaeon]
MTGDHDICPASRAGMLDHPIRRLIQSPKRIVGRYVHPGDRVLDVGCGPGFFSRAMARMVGESGCVVAADLQEEMLAMLRERAEKEGVLTRIHTHRTRPETLDLGDTGPFDFILAFYVVHETPDAGRFFREVAAAIRPGGSILVVEPSHHVGREEFEEELKVARAAGFVPEKGPWVLFSRTVLLQKPADG